MKSILAFFLLLFSLYNCIESESGNNFLPNSLLGSSNMNILNVVGQYAQKICGANNLGTYSTGNQNAGVLPNQIYCNSLGRFCVSTTCREACMDKSPYTKVIEFKYGAPSAQTTTPEIVFSHSIDNYGTQDQTGSYSFSDTVENSYSWGWSTTLTASYEFKVEAGLPGFASTTDSLTASISTTNFATTSRTTTKQWSSIANYVVPPKKRVKIDYIVSKTTYEVPFKMTVQFGDNFAFWCINLVNQNRFYRPKTYDVLVGQPNCSYDRCTFSGIHRGFQGISDSLTYRYCTAGQAC